MFTIIFLRSVVEAHEIKWAASGVINAVIKIFQYIKGYEKTLMQLLVFYGKLKFSVFFINLSLNRI